MAEALPFDEKEWNRFVQERRDYWDAGGPDSGRSMPRISGQRLTGQLSKGEDWSYSDFENCDLAGADLESANLQHCYLKNTDLTGANLKGADLTGAILIAATFSESNLAQASFSRANLENADVNGCDCTGVDFEGALLIGTDFSDSVLTEADLSRTRASGADFTQAAMKRADLTSGDFSGADFTDADLEEAVLSSADLKGAHLLQANLFEADLIKTDLTGAVTLGMNVGGANLTNAALPDAVAEFSSIGIIEESSKIIRTLFLTMLSAFAYSALTIASTTDAQLLTDSTSFPLPIIQTPVSIQQFYLVAPFGIAGLFLYFLLYLQRHYRLIAKLPAIFPDGTPFDERLYPWMFNTWLRGFYRKLEPQEKISDSCSMLFVAFLGWTTVTFLLLFVFLRNLVVQDFNLSLFHFGAMASVALLSCWFSHQLFNRIFRLKMGWGGKLLNFGLPLAMVAGGGAVLAHFGYSTGPSADPASFSSFYAADFIKQDVSYRPDNWDPKAPLQGVKGASLDRARLMGVKGVSAFLVKAKLEYADLRGASFDLADFRGARLIGTKMDYGNFVESNFEGADLSYARLVGANLKGAMMSNARLNGADIQFADLTQTQDLRAYQVTKSKNWRQAFLNDRLRREMGISDEDLERNMPDMVRGRFPGISEESLQYSLFSWKSYYGITSPLEEPLSNR